MTNADKYKTAEERTRAFVEFCDANGNVVCVGCRFKGCRNHCEFEWLELEYEDEKNEPCPFCGGETHTNLGHLMEGVVHYWVDCISPECMYRSSHYADRSSAIAAHNSVARAVKAAKEGGQK